MRLQGLRRKQSELAVRYRDASRVFAPCSHEERQHFIALHEEIRARFIGYAEKFLARDDAHDAVADVMAHLWERWATLTPGQRNDRYAFGILRHGIRSSLRSPDRFVGLDEAEFELELLSMRAHDEAIREREDAERDAVVAAVREREIEEMPVRRREVLLLVLEHDLSYREAGEALGLSKGTIAQHMRLAFQTLRIAVRHHCAIDSAHSSSFHQCTNKAA